MYKEGTRGCECWKRPGQMICWTMEIMINSASLKLSVRNFEGRLEMGKAETVFHLSFVYCYKYIKHDEAEVLHITFER